MEKLFRIILVVSGVCGLLTGCFLPEPAPETEAPQAINTYTESAVEDNSAVVEEIHPTPQVPEGWQPYMNEEYGFSFAYPENYSILTDEDNLYGWENGVLLLYNGGQSYDIAVQVWDNLEEPESLYGSRMEDIIVFEKGGQYITVFDITMEADNAAIVSTFQVFE